MDQIFTGSVIHGKKVYWFDMKNSNGTEVRLSNYGGILSKYLVVNKMGSQQDIVLGFDTIDEYISEKYLANYPYFGAVIGRYANRIKNGKIKLNNKEFQLVKNAGSHCLHGGAKGFDRKVWNIAETTSVPNDKVDFHYLSIAGEEGFPGNLNVNVSFELKETDELVISYTANCDSETLINLTHHDYFNLHPQKKNVADHTAQIAASFYLEQDAEYLPTGKILPVLNTPYDFKNKKKLGKDWDDANGYNQSFILDKDPNRLSFAAGFLEHNSGISLEVWSTAPIAHFYTGKYLPEIYGKNKELYNAYGAFAIELHNYPNAIRSDTSLAAEDTYRQTTIYKTFRL